MQNPAEIFIYKESLDISLIWLGIFTNHPEIPYGTFAGGFLPHRTLFLPLTYKSV